MIALFGAFISFAIFLEIPFCNWLSLSSCRLFFMLTFSKPSLVSIPGMIRDVPDALDLIVLGP